ncbi:MAG: potassium-transporting ATPase subunit KdpC [Candidatus Sericytochromatia bacterium]|nr:potassium-transporting ATPase subunit KdpC [Candidatus Sericytochromatia bacterium]
MNEFLIALRSLIALTLLTGVAYPLLVTGLGQLANAEAVQGSLIKRGEQVVGSRWLAQPFQQAGYFWPRPSAGDYATVASGASNKGPTSKDLLDKIKARKADLLKAHLLPADAFVPPELLMASGSGLDPELSPAAVQFQVPRVAHARGLQPQELAALIQSATKGPQLGLLGAPRVNVLELNMALLQLEQRKFSLKQGHQHESQQ